ncbi:MAG: leucine-rich repeat domain-containing protein, partial [Chryseobacterium sp.]
MRIFGQPTPVEPPTIEQLCQNFTEDIDHLQSASARQGKKIIKHAKEIFKKIQERSQQGGLTQENLPTYNAKLQSIKEKVSTFLTETDKALESVEKSSREKGRLIVIKRLFLAIFNFIQGTSAKQESRVLAQQLFNELGEPITEQQRRNNEADKASKDLQGWLNNPLVTGQKQEALNRIVLCIQEGNQDLDLSGLNLSEPPISKYSFTFMTIHTLNLSGNEGIKLSDEFSRQFQFLRTLHLSDNGLEELPRNMDKFIFLTTLLASKNHLQKLPESLGTLKNLTKLDLSDNKIEALPNSFGNLGNLEILRVANNKLRTLPKGFERLTKLRDLNLSYNQLQGLREDFGHLTCIENLNLSRNPLEELPENFGKLIKVTNLNLSDTQLQELPESFFQLTQITHLNLSNNPLEELSENFGKLTHVENLDISHTQLQTLPLSFENLKALQKLNLSHNELENLPVLFGKLKALQNLDLSYNKLENLPEDFRVLFLSNLEKLNLSNNYLSQKYN